MSLEELLNDKDFIQKVGAIVESISCLSQPEDVEELTELLKTSDLDNASYETLEKKFGAALAQQLRRIVSVIKDPKKKDKKDKKNQHILQRELAQSIDRRKALEFTGPSRLLQR